MKINPKKIIKNPTFRNLTEYALESASRFIAEAGRIPTVFWCVGHRGVMAIEFPDSTDGEVLEKCFEQCSQMCLAESAKANMVLIDSAVTDNGTPTRWFQNQQVFNGGGDRPKANMIFPAIKFMAGWSSVLTHNKAQLTFH